MIPSALQHVHEIAARGEPPTVFLDYDGTLTRIVRHSERAFLSKSMRQAVQKLAARAPVAILSGRDLDDVRRRVDIEGIIYAGSHGFDIAGPRGLRKQVATEFLPMLDAAEKELREKLAAIRGALLERKRFSIAAHYRQATKSGVTEITQAVDGTVARHHKLRRIDGKKVYELQPDIDWDKGKAVLWLLETSGLESRSGGIRPIYIGDDNTDEDAFRALKQLGVGILVSEQSQPTAARYSLENPAEVKCFLRALTTTLT
jgi:trehalose 6-phosphate phosphatase